MYVRILGHHEILNALHLAWEVYAQDILPKRTHEQIEEFQRFIKYENIMPKIQSGELKFFGAFDEDRLCGAGAIDRQGYISLLYVKKEMQEEGIDQMLVQAMNEALYQNVHTDMPKEKPKKKRRMVTIIIVAAVLVLAMIIGLIGFIAYKVVNIDIGHSIIEEFNVPYEDDIYGGYFGEEETEEEQIGGMQAIPEYIDKQAGYEITEDSYILNPEDTETTRTTIMFEIRYPQVTGLKDESVQEKVNEELKNCAMETAENIYLTPTDEIKETVLGEEYPVLASYVEYKVTYLSRDIISVVYQDYYYEGSKNNYHLGFRTRNINLNDGSVYEVKDIVKLNDRFIKDWSEEMRDEADTDKLMKELSENEMKDVLSGKDLDGVYYDNFFLDSEGMEIGLCFKYSADDKNDSGYSWVTAPFDWEDIREYKADSNFWELVE